MNIDELKFALCFPDLYEVGMSNLGIRILYALMNAMPGVVCERCFSPGLDLEAVLRDKHEKLFSLESRRPLSDFDMIGFSLGYELGYTNVLAMLELGGVPLSSSERDHRHPLVIGGGPCVMNPEPMHEFFDLFVFGEAEEALAEIIAAYQEQKAGFRSGHSSKEELLRRLARIQGVYVPSFYEPAVDPAGIFQGLRPRSPGIPARVTKRIVSDLRSSPLPGSWIVPYIQVVHDRITLELMRGCPNRCRFCQARAQYYPLRLRTPEEVVRKAEELYLSSGYEELALGGLSVSDYPKLKEVLEPLISGFKSKGVGVSLPSIKPKLLLGELADLIATVKKTGLTFAPEAGSERLRSAIGKDFNTDDFLKTLAQAYRSGYQHVKLYFMIGLPGETEADLDAILKLSREVSDLKRAVQGGPAQVNVSVNALIPKPHTAFQWCSMLSQEEISEKQNYLKSRNRSRRIKLSFHDPYMSFLEGVFSRGDRSLSAVIRHAYEKGCRFDGWQEHLNQSAWGLSFVHCGVDPGVFLSQKSPEYPLAWDFLDNRMAAGELEREHAELLKCIAIK